MAEERKDEKLHSNQAYWRGQVDGKLGSFDTRLENIETDVKEIKNLLKNGSDGKPGLISQVRDVTKWKGKVEKVSYAVLIAVFIDIVFRVLNSNAVSQLFSSASP